jgi:lipid II:glycine glycyltransferase (peptidoglycan interpeptide bridge formation enzyme)
MWAKEWAWHCEVWERNNFMSKEFLQSSEWKNFQASVGRKTFNISGENFLANIIEHELAIVGKYFYIPRGPIMSAEAKFDFNELINLAKKNKAGWIRIEPKNEELLEIIKKNIKYKIQKSPHDVQPKEIFVIDIAKSEEELLAEMKPKKRYNIKLAEKKGLKIFNNNDEKYIKEFLRLTKIMAKRQGINPHAENYYRKMLETIPGDILKLYFAQYQGKIIAANLVIFFDKTCIYLHGASDDNFRNVMAPYLLQWKQICDAKKADCVQYDFGGISTDKWQGITKFKLGFSPKTALTIFPGSYDIIVDNKKYLVYKILQKIKNIF